MPTEGAGEFFFFCHLFEKDNCFSDSHIPFILDIEIHQRVQPERQVPVMTSMDVVGNQFFCGKGNEQDFPNR